MTQLLTHFGRFCLWILVLTSSIANVPTAGQPISTDTLNENGSRGEAPPEVGDDIGDLYEAARQARENEQYNRALALYDRVLQIDSTEQRAYYRKSQTLGEEKQYRAAVEVLQTYERVDPTPDPQYIGLKGWYRLLAGEIDSARTSARRAIEMDPNNAAWPLNLGHSFILDHQPETAKYYYRQAMENVRRTDHLQLILNDFDLLAQERLAQLLSQDNEAHTERVRTAKDWFHVTYLREGEDLRSQTGWLAFFGTWITLVVGIISLFQESGKSLTTETRDAVRDWLLNSDYSYNVRQWPETFRALFESVFTPAHWSWTCLLRSALASTGMVALTFLVMIAFGWATTYDLAIESDSIVTGIVMAVLVIAVLNVFVDYLSLYQTRRVIGWMTATTKTWRHSLLIALDAGLTLLIPIVIFVSGSYLGFLMTGNASNVTLYQVVIGAPRAVFEHLPFNPVVQAVYISTFMTSIWLWLFVLGGFLIRAFNSALSQLQWLSALMDVERQPVKALGVILAMVVTVIFVISGPVVL